MIVAGTSAMIPCAVSSPSPAGVAKFSGRAVCERGAGGPVATAGDGAGACRIAAGAVLTGTGLGPAAAQARESALRLRGGEADGSVAAADAAPNGATPKSYKAVASAGVDVEDGGKEGATSSGNNGEEGENKIVLQIDELKLESLRKLGASLRVGGRGTARRKFKVVRKKTGKQDDVKFQNALRKVGLNQVGEIENVQVSFHDGTVWTYSNPRLLANQQASQFVVSGRYEERKPPPQTPAQVAAKEFDQLSDIEKLRQLAQAELPASANAADAADGVVDEDHHADKASPEDMLAAAEEEGGEGVEEEGTGEVEGGADA
jgi:nascent polypeptide-associated complex subunit beta